MSAKQEILGALGIAKAYLDADQPFTAEARLDRIRAILETHDLVRIYSQPFDPTLCGFEHTYHEDGQTPDARQWSNGDYVITREGEEGYIEEIGGKIWPNFPWPETQSAGRKLLELLGVLG